MAVAGEPPETEAEVLRRAERILAERLPTGWSIRPVSDRLVDRRIDGLLELLAPDGNSTTLVLEAKRVLEGRDVASLHEKLASFSRQLPNSQAVVVARYLSPPVRARLVAAGLSYVDATGNVRVEVPSPGLFVSDRGADGDPWRGPGRPRGTLKGVPAAKIVRTVADISGPWAVREIVDVAKVSTGAAYRVVDFLEREGLALRDETGLVNIISWAEVLRRWSEDYGLTRNSRVTRWIAPRGLPDLLAQTAKNPQVTYAVTGTLAAAEWAAYAPARLAMIYTADAGQAAEVWGLRPAEAGANVMLAEPEIDIVFVRTLTTRADVRIAAPTQVAVDLMSGPGRSPSEAEELLEWMTNNESSWRS